MDAYPNELRYTQTHEWVRLEDEEIIVVGISHHAQEQLGEIVSVKLPEKGDKIDAGDEVGIIESVKAATEVYAPISGEIIEVNEDLLDAPNIINTYPYGDGWIFKVKAKDEDEYTELMESSGYQDLIEGHGD